VLLSPGLRTSQTLSELPLSATAHMIPAHLPLPHTCAVRLKRDLIALGNHSSISKSPACSRYTTNKMASLEQSSPAVSGCAPAYACGVPKLPSEMRRDVAPVWRPLVVLTRTTLPSAGTHSTSAPARVSAVPARPQRATRSGRISASRTSAPSTSVRLHGFKHRSTARMIPAVAYMAHRALRVQRSIGSVQHVLMSGLYPSARAQNHPPLPCASPICASSISRARSRRRQVSSSRTPAPR
jgi:hypothetical protein